MEHIDAKVFTVIAAVTLVLIEAFKSIAPKFFKGREKGIALLIPILLTMGAKCGGFFQGTDWLDALMWAAGGGVASGVAHDKILEPVKKLLSGFLPKPPPSQ